MTDCFSFRFCETIDNQRKSVAVFFPSIIFLDEIAKALKNDVAHNLIPKNVYILSFGNPSVTVDECKADTVFCNEFISYVGNIDKQLIFLHADRSGHIFNDSNTPIDPTLERSILQSGMVELFKKHRGLITSSYGYHFTKPSGDHCDKFIRASNLLVSSIEVSFLAISLLPYLKNNLRRIYVDTSSIAYLVSVSLGLYGAFDDNIIPHIESFESYTVLKQKYDFVEDQSSLVIISATTSGSLAKRLLETTSFSKNQIVTLFYTKIPKEQQAIFNLSSAIPGGILSHRANDCPFCNRKSKVIRIAGEQFLPENPKHDLLIIKKIDFGRKRQMFFRQFAAESVLLWNKPVSSKEESREHFFIDVNAALSLNAEPFSFDMDKNIRRYVSRDLSTVIVLEDSGSQLFSERFRSYIGEDADTMRWFVPSDLDDNELVESASVIVIAGAITSGRSLLAISRKLRCIPPRATIIYFVAFSKLQNDESFKQLEKDLCQGGHQLIILNHCPLPRIKEYTKTAFDWEYEALKRLSGSDPFGDIETVLPSLLLDRFHLLDSSSSDSNQLFLPNPAGLHIETSAYFCFLG
ncbi:MULTISPECIES: hypothetical protein [unclassified Acidithiobacillus]|uniref:hypothetical protein n=1 Tax=unclassified Acidithiobacillus TaxID=2614800 RepID=UPI001D0D26A3|nr:MULTISPECIES: hypothetical protein [unclassified Acidithiobacillus]